MGLFNLESFKDSIEERIRDSKSSSTSTSYTGLVHSSKISQPTQINSKIKNKQDDDDDDDEDISKSALYSGLIVAIRNKF